MVTKRYMHESIQYGDLVIGIEALENFRGKGLILRIRADDQEGESYYMLHFISMRQLMEDSIADLLIEYAKHVNEQGRRA